MKELTLCDRCVRARLPCPIRDTDIMVTIEVCGHFIDRTEKEEELQRKMEAFIL